jgi:hypothetical protein
MRRAARRKRHQGGPPGPRTGPVWVDRLRGRAEAALARLLRRNARGRLSLAGAIALGWGGLGMPQRESDAPGPVRGSAARRSGHPECRPPGRRPRRDAQDAGRLVARRLEPQHVCSCRALDLNVPGRVVWTRHGMAIYKDRSRGA